MDWRLFAGLPDEDIRRLVVIARRRRFDRNEVVFHRGDPADSLQLISKGRFSVQIATPLGDIATLSVRGPGDAFGELALLGPESQRSATVSAIEPGETYSDQLIEAHYVSANRRVLRRVRELAELYGGRSKSVVVPLTQEDIAGLAGTSRATVNRVLREEERRGTVELRRSKTVVLNLDELSRRAR